MSLMIRLLFPLVGYVCVATVISAALGYGYMRSSGKLDDEKVLRIAALVHGVDLNEIATAEGQAAADVPPEEASFDQQQRQIQAATLHFDAKRKQLADSLGDFDFQLKRLTAATEQYSMLRDSVESYLNGQRDLVLNEQMKKVREQLESLHPKKQAKPILTKMIADDRIDEVILLLGSMKPQSQKEVLKAFDTQPDLDMLYEVQQKMLAGGPAKKFVEEKIKELEQLKKQEK